MADIWAQIRQQAQNDVIPPPPSVFAPMAPDAAPVIQTPQPRVAMAPNPTQQNIQNDQNQLQKVRWNQANPWGTANNHPGTAGKIAHVLSVAGNIAGNIFAPAVMASVPGSQMNMMMKEGGLAHRLNEETTQETENEARQAQTAKTQADTPTPEERQAGLEHTEAETESLGRPDLAHAYAAAVTSAMQRNVDPATDPVVQHIADAITSIQKQPTPKEDQTKTADLVGPDGKEHIMGWNDKTKKYDVDMGLKGEKPPVVKVDTGAHEFAQNERGRGLLDKAEAAYRTAQQGATGLRAMVDNASAGDKMSARMLPLEGALEITTSQGVHRINRTEVDQYAGGGNAFDRLAGMLKGATTGVPFTAEILKSMAHLADIQEKGAYDNYKGAYDSATKRYKLTDETPLAAPSGGNGQQPKVGDVKTFPNGKKGVWDGKGYVAQ